MRLEIEEFDEFAEMAMINHIVELHNKYENNGPPSDESMLEEYAFHRKILNDELDQKIEILVSENDPWVKRRALEIKNQYVENLYYRK